MRIHLPLTVLGLAQVYAIAQYILSDRDFISWGPPSNLMSEKL
jgi:hypothetical protein